MAFELEKLLKENGATVYICRVADRHMSSEGWSKDRLGSRDELQARIDYFEHYVPHFFLSVHHNAGPGSQTGGHTTSIKRVLLPTRFTKRWPKTSMTLWKASYRGRSRPLSATPSITFSGTRISPGTIAESGMLTNPAFDELSQTPEYQKKEAGAICKGAIKFWKDHKDAIVAKKAARWRRRTWRLTPATRISLRRPI